MNMYIIILKARATSTLYTTVVEAYTINAAVEDYPIDEHYEMLGASPHAVNGLVPITQVVPPSTPKHAIHPWNSKLRLTGQV